MYFLAKLDPLDIIIIVLCCVLVATISLVVVVMFFSKKKKLNDLNIKTNNEINKFFSNIVDICGGKDNIKDVKSLGSRVSIYLYEVDKVNKEAFKENNVNEVIYMSDKIVLVIGSDAHDFAESLLKEISDIK